MKKIVSLALAAAAVLSLTACGADKTASTSDASANTAAETMTITSLNGSKEEISLEVPSDPQRIAILDMASLDILDALGVGDRVVGTADTSLEYLQSSLAPSRRPTSRPSWLLSLT